MKRTCAMSDACLKNNEFELSLTWDISFDLGGRPQFALLLNLLIVDRHV
jgi:hypothetical protein